MTNIKSSPFKTGLLIIITIGLVLFSILWLRYFAIKPYMTIAAKFYNPGPIPKGLLVYFQGTNIGLISKIDYNEADQRTYVYLKIFKKVRIPDNSVAKIKAEGFAGQKFINIEPAEKPSTTYLKNGSVIEGQSGAVLNQVEDFIQNKQKTGELEGTYNNFRNSINNSSLITNNLVQITTELNNLLKNNKAEIDALLKNGSKSAQNIEKASVEINKIVTSKDFSNNLISSVKNINSTTGSLDKITGSPEVQEGIKNTVSGIGRIVKKTDKILNANAPSSELQQEATGTLGEFRGLIRNTNSLVNHWDTYSYNIYSDMERTQLVENVSNAFKQAGLTLDEARGLLDNWEQEGMDITTKELILNTLANTNTAAKSVTCLSNGVSDMLSKRFLFFRLLFGKPGENLEQCKQCGCNGGCIQQGCGR